MNNRQHAFSEPIFQKLLWEIYDAALDPSLWDRFFTSYSGIYHGNSILLIHDHTAHTAHTALIQAEGLDFVRHQGFDPALLEEFTAYYHTVDPWIDLVRPFPEGRAMSSGRHLPDPDFARTEYHAWLRQYDLQYCLAVNLIRKDEITATLAVSRSRRRGDYADGEIGFLERLAPHLRRACELNLRLLAGHSADRGVLAAFDSLGIAALILDRQGRLLAANQAAEALLHAGTALYLDAEGRCHPQQAALEGPLAAEIAAAVAGPPRGGGAGLGSPVSLPRPAPLPPLQLSVTPLVSAGEGVARTLLLGERPAALILLI